MKKTLALIIFFLLFNRLAYAHKGDQYLLPKVGFMAIQMDQPTPLWSVGLLYGYGLTNRLSVEAEANLGFNGGRYDKRDQTTGSIIEKGDYRIATVAAYGVYRFPIWQGGYIKSKLGLLFEKVTRHIQNTENRVQNDVGLAGGLGFGMNMVKSATVEFEATIIDKDIIFYSLGTHVRF